MSSEAWMEWAKQTYNTDEAGVRQLMSDKAKISAQKKRERMSQGIKPVGGFSNVEVAKEAGKKGRTARWKKD